MRGDTEQVRPGEELDWQALATYVRWHFRDGQLPGLLLDTAMEVSQFPGGHSNLTYLLRFGGAELVLRRPPIGPVPPKAHDMAREYRWLAALHPHFSKVPRPYVLCEDEAVIGSVFYLMERRRGIVVRGTEPMPLAGHPALRRQLAESMVDSLAELHQVDITAPPLAALGKPVGFLDRQVRGWTERWERARLEPVPPMDAVALWLAAHQPAESLTQTVVHGDFKLDNVLLDPLTPSHITAILDWEMAALGDPLVDLGIMLAYWTLADVPGLPDALRTVSGEPGYLTRDALVDRYGWKTGFDTTLLPFYETFAIFKIAVVLQQILKRFRQGQTRDSRFATFGDSIVALARRAEALASRSQ